MTISANGPFRPPPPTFIRLVLQFVRLFPQNSQEVPILKGLFFQTFLRSALAFSGSQEHASVQFPPPTATGLSSSLQKHVCVWICVYVCQCVCKRVCMCE